MLQPQQDNIDMKFSLSRHLWRIYPDTLSNRWKALLIFDYYRFAIYATLNKTMNYG